MRSSLNILVVLFAAVMAVPAHAADATRDDFKQHDALYSRDVMDALIEKGTIGDAPERALVPVQFDANGALVRRGGTENYFTTLDKYQQLMGVDLDSAKAKVLGGANGKPVYIYDAD